MLSLGICISIASFNATGVAVTKYASAPQRTTIDSTRTVVVWVFFLMMPEPYTETFSWLQLFGFIILILGTLVYNEIIVVPLWGFD